MASKKEEFVETATGARISRRETKSQPTQAHRSGFGPGDEVHSVSESRGENPYTGETAQEVIDRAKIEHREEPRDGEEGSDRQIQEAIDLILNLDDEEEVEENETEARESEKEKPATKDEKKEVAKPE